MKAKFHYYLQNPKKESSPVRLHIHYNGTIPISIGVIVPTKHWSKKTERLKQSYKYAHLENKVLDRIMDNAVRAFLEIRAEGIPISAGEIRERIFPQKKIKKADESIPSFIEAWGIYIQQRTNTRTTNTLKVYRTTQRNLEAFKAATGYTLTYDSINFNFLEEFQSYLIEDRDMGNRTISKNIDNVKTFMRWAKRKGFHSNSDFEDLKVSYRSINHIALTEEELESWRNVHVSDRLDLCRDMFLFSCLTSLRISDLYQLEPRHIDVFEGNNCLSLLSTIKTKDRLFFPLEKEHMEILYKWKGLHKTKCFPLPPQQIYNRLIKEVGKLALISGIVERQYYRGPKLLKEMVPKYTLIKSHTARRTFITHYVNRGGTMANCRRYTGHSSNKELEQYWDKSPRHILESLKR